MSLRYVSTQCSLACCMRMYFNSKEVAAGNCIGCDCVHHLRGLCGSTWPFRIVEDKVWAVPFVHTIICILGVGTLSSACLSGCECMK